MSDDFIYAEVREKTQWIAFGKKNAKQDSRIVDVNESLEATVKKIKKSAKYSNNDKEVFIYELTERNAKSSDPTLLLMPTTDLANKFTIAQVKEGDKLKITYLGEQLTGKGKPMKKFDLGIVKGN